MFKRPRNAKSENAASPAGPSAVKIIVSLAITLVVGLVMFYVSLPALNPMAQEFYFFIGVLILLYSFLILFSTGALLIHDPPALFAAFKKNCFVPLVLLVVLIAVYIVGNVISMPIFNAGRYSSLISISEGDFIDDVEEISFDQIPMLDKESAERLGDRKLGELSDMVSQFEVSIEYSQINFQHKPTRVTSLLYGDIIKWFNNRNEGIPAYITIDMVTQEANVHRLEEGIKYSSSELFGRNLERHLRFNYPTYIFEYSVFEVDESGHPYWVCPKLVKTIGLFGGLDIDGAVLVDAVTGECRYYAKDEVPTWVDRVYSADLIVQQYDYYGKLRNGFFNSIFGQRGVTVTTEGYNYIALNDDVYMYTGVTSVAGDESNVGFILSNQRTKETKYYPIAGAEEYSAISSAEGVVQHLGYKSTFPLLLNISNQPTYFMALKDNARLVKMYAMVNVEQYQIVATGSTVSQCESEYIRLLAQNNISVPEKPTEYIAEGVIEEMRSAVIEGTTYYFVKLRGDSDYYKINAADSLEVIILNTGDSVTIEFFDEGKAGFLTGQKIYKN